MRKFSASYNNVNPNFVISTVGKKAVGEPFVSLFSVCRNILNRGVCTGIPEILSSHFRDVNVRDEITYTKCDVRPKWSDTIKGGSTGNPARDFYENSLNGIISSTFGPHNSFLTYTFLPECPMDLISKEISQRFALDFYSPVLGLCVEIDGTQHSLKEQLLKDRQRDMLLNISGIELVRLRTSDLSSGNFSLLRNKLKNAVSTKEIPCFADVSDLGQSDIDCMYLVRLEHLLLSLLEDGIISLSDKEWRFDLVCRERVRDDILELAWADLRTLIAHVSALMGIDIALPEMIADDKNGISVDVSVLRYYDEDSEHCISVRNDYFPYDPDSDVKERYPFFKNHYHVSNGELVYHIGIEQTDEYGNRYRLTNKEQHLALTYILRYCFGFDSFRDHQEEIIAHCLNEQSVIGVLPTSAGKSLCYQMCSLLIPGSTLVISPLKSLMEDQYGNLCSFGISNVCFLNGDNKKIKTDTVLSNRSLITLISPERFFSSEFTSFLSNTDSVRYRLIAVDEVHCISEWGHDFRTSYLCLSHSMNRFFKRNCSLIGLTATASPNVAEDIVAEFNSFKDNTLLITADSLNRPELKLHPICFPSSADKYRWLKDFVTENTDLKDKTVVFTKFVNSMDDSSCISLSNRIKDFTKTGDLDLIDFFCGSSSNVESDRTNSEKMNNFKSGETRLLFATKAFGMGVNIPDIRNTVHYGLSGSIESIYQEFGRAGRDGKESDCYILFEKEYIGNLGRLGNKALTIKDLKDTVNDFTELRGNVYFISSSNSDIEEETDYIWRLYNFIRSKQSFARKEFDTSKDAPVEKGLYRLLTLGIIGMWTVTYSEDISNPTYSSIHINTISIEDCIANLERYIRRYDLKYRYNGPMVFKSVLKELLNWNFNNFVRNRIESLRLLYEYCSENQTSDGLMNAITSFLTADPGLKGIVNNEDPKAWFDYIERTSPEKRKYKTDRYLESYHNDKALDFISALSAFELSRDIENDTKVRERMASALKEVRSMPEEDMMRIVTGTFTAVTDKDKAEQMVMLFLENLPEYSNAIYELTGSELAARFILSKYNEELKKIGEMLNDKT